MFKKLKNKTYNLLRWSEKYTKTDMVYLGKGEFWLTSGQIISSAGTFLLAIAFANLLPKETYGQYKYVLSIASILAVTTLVGMNGVITQAVARGLEGSVLVALKNKIKYGTLGTLVGFGFFIYYYIQNNNVLAISFFILAITLPFMESFELYDSVLLAKKEFKLSTIYKTTSRVLAALILIITLFITNNLIAIIIAYFISWTILRFTFLKQTLKKFPPNEKEDPKTINYGKHSSLVNVTATLIGSIDALILYHYLGSTSLAIYAFAIAPVVQIRSLVDKIPVLALPKLAKRSILEINKIFWKRFLLLTIIGASIALCYSIAAPVIFKIFFPQYMDSVIYSQVFSISIILTLAPAVLSAVISSRLTTIPKKMLYIYNIPSIVFIIVVLLTIQNLGTMGVVISRLISSASGIIISIIVWEKIKKIESNKTF